MCRHDLVVDVDEPRLMQKNRQVATNERVAAFLLACLAVRIVNLAQLRYGRTGHQMHLEIIIDHHNLSARADDTEYFLKRPRGIREMLQDETHEDEIKGRILVTRVKNRSLPNYYIQ